MAGFLSAPPQPQMQSLCFRGVPLPCHPSVRGSCWMSPPGRQLPDWWQLGFFSPPVPHLSWLGCGVWGWLADFSAWWDISQLGAL